MYILYIYNKFLYIYIYIIMKTMCSPVYHVYNVLSRILWQLVQLGTCCPSA